MQSMFFVVALFLLTVVLGGCSDDSASAQNENSLSPYTAQIYDSVEFSLTEDYTALKNFDFVLSKTNAAKGKIAFREEASGRLILWDSEKEGFWNLNNGIDAYHPEISPDGNWIAFCTKFESMGGTSKMYVQNLRNGAMLQLDVSSALVPRWRVLPSGDTAIVYVDNGGLTQKAEWKSYGTWMTVFKSGTFEKPKKLFEGAFVGVSDDFRFAVAGGADLINRKVAVDGGNVSYVDSLWYNGEQVCNLSLAKDNSLRTSILDMAGTMGLEYAGSSFRPHEKLLVLDSLGKIIQAVTSPEGYAYDHTEWASQGEFEIATLQSFAENLAHTRIALIDMSSEETFEIVRGGDMYHPCLWLEK